MISIKIYNSNHPSAPQFVKKVLIILNNIYLKMVLRQMLKFILLFAVIVLIVNVIYFLVDLNIIILMFLGLKIILIILYIIILLWNDLLI